MKTMKQVLGRLLIARRRPVVWAVLGTAFLLGAGATDLDAQAKLTRSEFEARIAAFEFLFENYVTRHPKGDADDFCIVSGRRSYVALQYKDRDDGEWDPTGPFLRRFTGRGVGVHAISECTWDGDQAEMVAATGAPAIAVAMAPVSWETELSGSVHMRIQENWRHVYGLRCMVTGTDGAWRVFNCVDRPVNPSFIGED
jgi:hypothetical protein